MNNICTYIHFTFVDDTSLLHILLESLQPSHASSMISGLISQHDVSVLALRFYRRSRKWFILFRVEHIEWFFEHVSVRLHLVIECVLLLHFVR